MAAAASEQRYAAELSPGYVTTDAVADIEDADLKIDRRLRFLKRDNKKLKIHKKRIIERTKGEAKKKKIKK